MYHFDARVRYSETDREGRLTLEGMLNYFQDCSIFHSESLGLGIAYLNARKQAWLLSGWQVVVDRYPALGETVTVGTFPYDFKGFIGYRNFFLKDAAGKYCACANTIWSLVDMEKGRPCLPDEKMLAGYVLEEKLPMAYAPRRIAVPEAAAAQEPLTVKQYQIDSNDHVNNCQYVVMAMEYLPQAAVVRQMRAEYKQSAKLQEHIFPLTAAKDDIYTVSLNTAGGKPYAVVEFVLEDSGKPAGSAAD